jgi:hypothetical protein
MLHLIEGSIDQVAGWLPFAVLELSLGLLLGKGDGVPAASCADAALEHRSGVLTGYWGWTP